MAVLQSGTATAATSIVNPRALPSGVVTKVATYSSGSDVFEASLTPVYMMKIPNHSVIIDMHETHHCTVTCQVAMGYVGSLTAFSFLGEVGSDQINRATRTNLPYVVDITDTATDQFLYITASVYPTVSAAVSIQMVVTYVDADSLANA